MESNGKGAASGGIGFLGALALIFITLKLTGFIAWPWVWVLAPLWIPFAAALVALMVFFVLWLLGGRQ